MLLDLSEIVIRQGMRVDLDVDQPRVEDPDLDFTSPITGKLTFENGGDLLSIEGALQTSLRSSCGRCLKEVVTPLKIPVEERFHLDLVRNPSRKPHADEDWDTTVSQVVYLEDGRPILDLDELMRQWIVAEVPMRVLCDESCAGLCSGCGADLNQGPCGCEATPIDPRLAGLGALLTNGSGDSNAADRS